MVYTILMSTEKIPHSEVRRGGASIGTTIPIAIVRELGLKIRDKIYWSVEPDGVKLKFVRRVPTIEVPVQPATQAESAASS